MLHRTLLYLVASILPLAMALPAGLNSGSGRSGPQEPPKRQTASIPLVKEIRRVTAKTGVEWKLLIGPSAVPARKGQALYIIPARDSSLLLLEHEQWHTPGRLSDAGTNKCYYEADVFAGEVLRDTIGVIWYDRTLMPDGRWKENTTLVNRSGPVPDTLVFFGQGRRSTTLGLAFRGKCALLDTARADLKPAKP